MKSVKYMTLLLAGMWCVPVFAAGDLDAEYGGWKFGMSATKKMTVEQGGKKLLSGVTMTAFDADDNELQSDKYSSVTKKEEDVNDAFG